MLPSQPATPGGAQSAAAAAAAAAAVAAEEEEGCSTTAAVMEDERRSAELSPVEERRSAESPSRVRSAALPCHRRRSRRVAALPPMPPRRSAASPPPSPRKRSAALPRPAKKEDFGRRRGRGARNGDWSPLLATLSDSDLSAAMFNQIYWRRCHLQSAASLKKHAPLVMDTEIGKCNDEL